MSSFPYIPGSILSTRFGGLSHRVFILEAWTGSDPLWPWVNCGEEKGAQRHEANQVPFSTLAAIKKKKCHGLGGLDNKRLSFTVQEARRSEIRQPAWPDSGESSVPAVQTSLFLLCPHMAERGQELWSLPLLTRALLLGCLGGSFGQVCDS